MADRPPLADAPFASLVGVAPSPWMMVPAERLALLGVLTALRPRTVLEMGCADGGLTHWLSQASESVVTVDIEPRVRAVAAALPNVTALCMTTDEAVAELEREGRRFDLTIIDADHSEAGIRRDLVSALRFSEVILCHDAYHPPCRRGILAALEGRDVWHDLDLVPGGLQPDGLWGGLGLVIPGVPRDAPRHGTSRRSVFPWLSRTWSAQQSAARVRQLVSRGVERLTARR